jgi:type III secretion protein S
MDTGVIVDLSMQALKIVFILTLPTVIVSATVGLLVAFLEAITQIQEQSIGMTIKIIAVLITVMLTAHWMGDMALNFAERLFALIPSVGPTR